MNQTELNFELENINNIASKLLNKFNSKTILFYGEMGSGKTTLITSLIKSLKSEDIASSPTFSIVNEYAIPNDKIFHFDFYRIESIEEAFNFGVEDYLYSGNWLFIEWPQLIEPLLEKDFNTISLSINDDNSRKLKLETNLF